jgi:hypothetical protein
LTAISHLSQRTLVRLMDVLEAQTTVTSDMQRGFDFYPWLYEHDFPHWFVTHAQSNYLFEWRRIIVDLRNGEFFFAGNSWFSGGVGSILGHYLDKSEAIELGATLLERLTVLATTLDDAESLKRSLEVDGLEPDVKTLKLHAVSGPVSVAAEQSRTDALGKHLDNPAVARSHSEAAARLFIAGDFHPSLNESRNFIQEVIDQISTSTEKHGGHSAGLPGGTANRIGYLKNVGFLSSDEENAFKAAWGMLSAGSHPGIPLQDEARIGLILSLELGQILLLKLGVWKANSYAKF